MTGIPTQLALADMVLDSLRVGAGPVPEDADLPFFYLGAIGPTLGDFLPTEPGTTNPSFSQAPLFDVWAPVLGLLAGTPGTPPTPGLYSNVLRLKDILRRLGRVARDESKLDLLDMEGELTTLPDLINTIQGQVSSVNGMRSSIQSAIRNARPRNKVPPTIERHARDVLHSHRTGTFWEALHRGATASADSRVRAFGLGTCVGYAGALCGNPFINGVVGGTYRNHWWRHRWVSQCIDAWVWGYDRTRRQLRFAGQEVVFPPPPPGASTEGRVPVPPYKAWKNIAGSDLQDKFAVGGISPTSVLDAIRDRTMVPAFLPAELVTLWLDCAFTAHGDFPLGFDRNGVQGAYGLAWLITWINGSGSLFGSTPPNRINDPDGCGERPPWVEVDGSVVVGGTVVTPPTPAQAMPNPSAVEIASAVAAAILGGIAYFMGAVVAGITLLVSAAVIVDESTDPDWHVIRCHLGWVNSFLTQLDNAFRDLLRVSGLGPPFAVQLAHNEVVFQSRGGRVLLEDSALNTCVSPSRLEEGRFPQHAWSATESDWITYPDGRREEPGTVSYPRGSWFPRHFLDGLTFNDNGTGASPRFTSVQTNPLATSIGMPLALDPAEWEKRMKEAEDGAVPQGEFGNAVSVALALLGRAPDQKLLDWDLDGDRGLGWPTWVRDGSGVIRE